MKYLSNTFAPRRGCGTCYRTLVNPRKCWLFRHNENFFILGVNFFSKALAFPLENAHAQLVAALSLTRSLSLTQVRIRAHTHPYSTDSHSHTLTHSITCKHTVASAHTLAHTFTHSTKHAHEHIATPEKQCCLSCNQTLCRIDEIIKHKIDGKRILAFNCRCCKASSTTLLASTVTLLEKIAKANCLNILGVP